VADLQVLHGHVEAGGRGRRRLDGERHQAEVGEQLRVGAGQRRRHRALQFDVGEPPGLVERDAAAAHHARLVPLHGVDALAGHDQQHVDGRPVGHVRLRAAQFPALSGPGRGRRRLDRRGLDRRGLDPPPGRGFGHRHRDRHGVLGDPGEQPVRGGRAAPGEHGRRRQRGGERCRDHAAAELLEHGCGVGEVQAEPAAAFGHEHRGEAQLCGAAAPQFDVVARLACHHLPHSRRSRVPVEEGRHRATHVLPLGVPGRGGHRGSPSIRSAMMVRCTSLDPP
jgi:hypothetical protein